MSEYALRLANGQDTAARVRAADALGLTPNGTVRSRAGLRPDGGGVVSIVAGTMNSQVTAFSCWVDASPAGQVGYPFICDATKTLTHAPGDATLVRVDTIAVVIKENAFDGSGTTAATLQIVQGTPGAGAPAMPTSACIPIRDVIVPAGASTGSGGMTSGALGTDRRVYTAAVGGIVRTASDLTSPQEAQAEWRTDTKQLKIHDGTAWRTVYDAASPAGIMTFTGSGSIPTGSATKVPLDTSVLARGITVDTTNRRIVITKAGLYLVTSFWPQAIANNTGEGGNEIRINGSTTNYAGRSNTKITTAWSFLTTSDVVSLSIGDYLEMWATQSSGASYTIPASADIRPKLTATRIGD